MPYLDLSGPDRKLTRKTLEQTFTSARMEQLVADVYPRIRSEINFNRPPIDVADSVMDTANRHGVLDRVVAAAAAERPQVDRLRAIAFHLSSYGGWTASIESHGMDVAGALEKLTSPGNPFMDTTLLARWLIRSERQVCRVRCGAELGTGFLVAPDLVMTCYHVVQGYLDETVSAAQVGVLFDYRRGPNGDQPTEDPAAWVGIDGDWTVPFAPYSTADITLEGEPADDELDYAILKLRVAVGHEPPGDGSEPRGWIDMTQDAALPAPREPILIVQHPGVPGAKPPAQQPLQIAFATPGFVGPIPNGTRVAYKPSTLPGSSGSPVFDRTFAAVALHHNRGQIDPAAVNLVHDNRGIPLERIRAHLDDVVLAAMKVGG